MVDEITMLYSVIMPKMVKKCNIQNFDFPVFLHKLFQNTFKPGLNVIKCHCGVGKKDSLNFEKFKTFSTLLGLQV